MTATPPPAVRVGVDTGGTFTDVVAVGAGGALVLRKLPSTPDDPAREIGRAHV